VRVQAAADDFGPNTATPVEEPMPQAVEPELFAQPNLDAEAAAPDATAVKTIRDLRATCEPAPAATRIACEPIPHPCELKQSHGSGRGAPATGETSQSHVHRVPGGGHPPVCCTSVGGARPLFVVFPRAATLTLPPPCRLEVKFQEVATAKGEAARARSALEGWQNAFRDECKGMEPEPGAVAEALLTLRGAERKAGEAARDAKKREAALLFRVQAKEQELLELRSQVADLKTARLPENKDIHTLLLDPAVHSEFLRLQVSRRPVCVRAEKEATRGGFSLRRNVGGIVPTRKPLGPPEWLSDSDVGGSARGGGGEEAGEGAAGRAGRRDVHGGVGQRAAAARPPHHVAEGERRAGGTSERGHGAQAGVRAGAAQGLPHRRQARRPRTGMRLHTRLPPCAE
jgi:hypothetical protein